MNSSNPKQKLLRSDPRVASACKNAPGDNNWEERDIIYAVGYVQKNTTDLKILSMVYGTEYCASHETYDTIFNAAAEKIHELDGYEFSRSKELAHINEFDPLGRTYWRARSLWGIHNPWVAFNDIYHYDDSKSFPFMCIINTQKWESFQNVGDLIALSKNDSRLKISNVQVKDPDNEENSISAKLITFSY